MIAGNRIVAGVGTLVALAVAAIVAGCNVVAPVAMLMEGPPTVPAQYELEDRPTLVFVDDRKNVVERAGAVNPRQTRLLIAETASSVLMANELVTTTISPRDATAYAMRNDRHSELLAIDAIGRAVGADQVIYVEILSFRSTSDGFTPKPSAGCQVRVIDVEKRKRIFPEGDETSVYVDAVVFGASLDDYRTRSGQLRVYDALAEETGRAVARLFYEHETLEVGSSIKTQ